MGFSSDKSVFARFRLEITVDRLIEASRQIQQDRTGSSRMAFPALTKWNGLLVPFVNARDLLGMVLLAVTVRQIQGQPDEVQHDQEAEHDVAVHGPTPKNRRITASTQHRTWARIYFNKTRRLSTASGSGGTALAKHGEAQTEGRIWSGQVNKLVVWKIDRPVFVFPCTGWCQ